jgi:hypothetical protein
MSLLPNTYKLVKGKYVCEEEVWEVEGWESLADLKIKKVTDNDSLVVLPSGDTVFYRDSQHRYFLVTEDGLESLTSVTSVLKVIDKPGLLRAGVALALAGQDPFEVWAKASTRGTSVHNALEELAQFGTIPDLESFVEEDRGYVSGLCSWWAMYSPSTIKTEVIVASPDLLVAGRFDLLCEIDGVVTLVDLKTGKGKVYKEHWLQLSLYEILMKDSGLEPLPTASAVLAVGPDGVYEYKATPDIARELAPKIVEMFYGLKKIEGELK